jgi:hypothetical protein
MRRCPTFTRPVRPSACTTSHAGSTSTAARSGDGLLTTRCPNREAPSGRVAGPWTAARYGAGSTTSHRGSGPAPLVKAEARLHSWSLLRERGSGLHSSADGGLVVGGSRSATRRSSQGSEPAHPATCGQARSAISKNPRSGKLPSSRTGPCSASVAPPRQTTDELPGGLHPDGPPGRQVPSCVPGGSKQHLPGGCPPRIARLVGGQRRPQRWQCVMLGIRTGNRHEPYSNSRSE